MQLNTFFWPTIRSDVAGSRRVTSRRLTGYVVPSGRPEMYVTSSVNDLSGCPPVETAYRLTPGEKVRQVPLEHRRGWWVHMLPCPSVSAEYDRFLLLNVSSSSPGVHAVVTGQAEVTAVSQLCRVRVRGGQTIGGVVFDGIERLVYPRQTDRYLYGLGWNESVEVPIIRFFGVLSDCCETVDRVIVAHDIQRHFLFGMTRYRLWALSVDQELFTENDPGERYQPIVYRHDMFPVPLHEKDNRTPYFVLPGPNGQPGAWERVYTAAVTEQQAIFVSFNYQQDMTVRLRRFRLDPVRKAAHQLDDLVFPIGSPPNVFLTNRTSIHLTPDELMVTVFIPAGNFRAKKVKRNGDLSKYTGKVAAVSLTVDLE